MDADGTFTKPKPDAKKFPAKNISVAPRAGFPQDGAGRAG